MKKTISLVTWLYLGFFAILSGMIYIVWLPIRGGELYVKPRYDYLHRVDYEYKDSTLELEGKPIFLDSSDARPYAALGVPASHNKASYIWIVLDDADNEIKKVVLIPQHEDFVLSCRYVTAIESKIKLARNTSMLLHSHCSNDLRRPN